MDPMLAIYRRGCARWMKVWCRSRLVPARRARRSAPASHRDSAHPLGSRCFHCKHSMLRARERAGGNEGLFRRQRGILTYERTTVCKQALNVSFLWSLHGTSQMSFLCEGYAVSLRSASRFRTPKILNVMSSDAGNRARSARLMIVFADPDDQTNGTAFSAVVLSQPPVCDAQSVQNIQEQ
jgi:hypothetical protein